MQSMKFKYKKYVAYFIKYLCINEVKIKKKMKLNGLSF